MKSNEYYPNSLKTPRVEILKERALWKTTRKANVRIDTSGMKEVPPCYCLAGAFAPMCPYASKKEVKAYFKQREAEKKLRRDFIISSQEI